MVDAGTPRAILNEEDWAALGRAAPSGEALPGAPANQAAWDNWAKSVVAVMKKRAAKDFDDLSKAVAEIVGEKVNAMQATIDATLVQMRRDFIQSVKSKASEMARYQVDGRIQSAIDEALKDHRAERVALVRRVEQLADQIERMKQEAGR